MEAILLMQCIIMENTLIKLTLHDETKKRAYDSQIVRAKENLKLSHDGSTDLLTTRAPITTTDVCVCRLLKCFNSVLSNSVGPDHSDMGPHVCPDTYISQIMLAKSLKMWVLG